MLIHLSMMTKVKSRAVLIVLSHTWKKTDKTYFICSSSMSSLLHYSFTNSYVSVSIISSVSFFKRFTLTASNLIFYSRTNFADYSFLAEHTDLRHIMGVGIALTRGSAASLSFGYCLLLLTMSRNLLTKLKDFSIQQYIPLDSHIPFHKVIACTAFFFSIIHTVGHIINFYHVSTQPLENLHCLTSEIHFPSDYKPGISFWLFKTITGT